MKDNNFIVCTAYLSMTWGCKPFNKRAVGWQTPVLFLIESVIKESKQCFFCEFRPTNLCTSYMASHCLSFRHPSWVWAEKMGNCPWPPKKVCHFVVQILFWVWEISVLLLIEIDIRNLHRHKILCLNLMLITSGVSLCCPKKYASCLKTTTLNVSKPLKMAAIIMNVSLMCLFMG